MHNADDPTYACPLTTPYIHVHCRCKQRNIFGKNNVPSEELAITNTKGNSMNT